jgi:hypothetical protein
MGAEKRNFFEGEKEWKTCFTVMRPWFLRGGRWGGLVGFKLQKVRESFVRKQNLFLVIDSYIK